MVEACSDYLKKLCSLKLLHQLYYYFFHSCCILQGVIIFHDVFDNEHNVGGAQIRVEGVYIWPFRQLRMVANRLVLWSLVGY